MKEHPAAPPWGPEEIEAYRARLVAEFARLRPLLPDIPPGDLLLLLQARLRPFGTGKRFFLKKLDDGRYVF